MAKVVEKIVFDFSLRNPNLGQAQVSAQLKTNYDIEISPDGVIYSPYAASFINCSSLNII
jgi:hypothetical protein